MVRSLGSLASNFSVTTRPTDRAKSPTSSRISLKAASTSANKEPSTITLYSRDVTRIKLNRPGVSLPSSARALCRRLPINHRCQSLFTAVHHRLSRVSFLQSKSEEETRKIYKRPQRIGAGIGIISLFEGEFVFSIL